MKKLSVVMILIVLLSFSGWFTFDYVSQAGSFTKTSHSSMHDPTVFDQGKEMYLAYDVIWEGIGSPELKGIEVRQKGLTMEKEAADFHVEVLINPSMTMGLLDADLFYELGMDQSLLEVDGFQVEGPFQIILRVKGADVREEFDVTELAVTYEKFGVDLIEYIDMDEGVLDLE
ncbi:hypothetical protein [Jeotgalibacillus sp. R-1-5s-1]|uniref:hypothetical protein n=1 Tax=Jeotgalibacillus sp. R-1-5s-1 TaxID=2555897 RepID=UPI00106D4133|nr:hypothetical protein [Jeotgalibacillus sp. R-1-5s-1]TFD94455.1 hypothetical protein E2491_13550 [Jeotgalibacillus sp. R-1-5s-1]